MGVVVVVVVGVGQRAFDLVVSVLPPFTAGSIIRRV